MRSKGIVFRVLFHTITTFHTKLKLYVTAVGYGPPMLPVNLGLLLVSGANSFVLFPSEGLSGLLGTNSDYCVR